MIPAYPTLDALAAQIRAEYAAARPGWSLRVTCTGRTLREQQAAYKAGKSSLDGLRRWSLHQYAVFPMAIDHAVIAPDGSISWEFADYLLYGQLARGAGLTWGGDWPALRDGPHIELTPRARVWALQQALADRGYDPGAVDGFDGPRTQAALRAAEVDARRAVPGLPATVRPHWPHPDLWAWLHRPAERAITGPGGLGAAV